MTTDVIATGIGPVPVFHRLALGLVVRDAVSNRGVVAALRVGWEASGHLLVSGRSRPRPGSGRPGDPRWPCVDFERSGDSRFRLRATPARPQVLTVRVYDPARRYVSRRIEVTLWPHDRILDDRPNQGVSVAARTIPVWLLPGAAYPLARGTTAIRGRVARQGVAVPWARVVAVDSGDPNTVLGRTHGDDRGEFLLVLARTNQNPVQSAVDVRLIVQAPAVASADPPVETAQRPGNPAGMPGDLDLPVLRGETPSPAHLPNTAPAVTLTVPVGAELVGPSDIPFQP